MKSGGVGDEERRGDDGEMRCVHQHTAELSMRGAEKRLGQLEIFEEKGCLPDTASSHMYIHTHKKTTDHSVLTACLLAA